MRNPANIRSTFPPALLLSFLSLVPAGSLRSQDGSRAADLLMSAGDSLARHGQTDEAITRFAAIPETNPAFIPAHRKIGKLCIDQQRWGSALDEFLIVLERVPSDTEAHYFAGICYREKGKEAVFFNMLLGKGGSWYKSNEYFEWVIARDSSYDDVLLQLAMLYQYREDYVRSIEIGRLQARLKPDDADQQIGLFRLYRAFIAEDSRKAKEWLTAHFTDYAPFFLAEILRREKKLDDADSLFKVVLTQHREIPAQPTYLSLARISYSRDDASTAEHYYWRALDECTNDLGFDFLLEDLKYVLSDEELQEYFSLSTTDQRKAFIRSFWEDRNPTPGSATNARLTQHYQRLLAAEERYEYTGFRTQFNNPDRYHRLQYPKTFTLNDQFNDKGLVYIRYGSPDVSFTPHGLHNIDQRIEPEESWVYYKTDESEQKIINFAKTETLKNIYRFTPLPSDPNIQDQLASYDQRYMRLDPAVEDMIIEDQKKTVVDVLSTDRYTYDKKDLKIEIPYSIDTFRTDKGNDLVDVSFAVPMDDFRKAMNVRADSLRSEVSLVFRNTKDRVILSRFDTLTFRSTKNQNGSDVRTYRMTVAPDTYSVSMRIQPLGADIVSHWHTRKAVPSFAGSDLSLSDIQLLLPSPERGRLEVQGVKVGPNPFRVWPREQLLYVYFHVYNLKRDEDGKSAFGTQYILRPVGSKNIFAALSNLFSSSTKPSFQKESFDLGTEDFFHKFSVLDLRDVDPGPYTLEVTVTDRKSKTSVTRSIPLQLSK